MAIFAKFGKIEGSVSAKGFEKHIELLSAIHSSSRDVSMEVGTGRDREADIPEIQHFQITKAVDKSSPKMWMSSLVGKAIDKVEIKFIKTSEDALEQYLTFTLEGVLVSGYNLGDVKKEQGEEALSLAYNKILMKYCPREPDNSLGNPIPAGYDVTLGKKI